MATARKPLVLDAGTVKELPASDSLDFGHEDLDTLVHNIARSNDGVVTRSGGLISSVIQYQTGSIVLKIREVVVTRSAGLVSQVQLKQYADDGSTLLKTLTRVYTRSGGLIASFVDTVT